MKKLFLFLIPALLFSQEAPLRPLPHTVRAAGEATVKAAPDQAKISVGITARASTAEDAVAQDAAKAAPVLSALKGMVHSASDIRTTNYSVEPEYKYEQGQSPTITGYQASQTVEVTLDNVALAGKVIDACSKAGATNFNRIEFSLKDDQHARTEAIAKATAIARANAETIAKALGVSVTGVAWAETTESGIARPIPVAMMRAQSMAASPSTQIESGNLEIHASVTVALEVR